MFNRDHNLRETYDYLVERDNEIVKIKEEKMREKDKERQEFYDQLNKYRKQRELKDSEISNFSEAVYDENLETALEAIYISALEKVAPLTEEVVTLAKSLVSNYIKENGGASEIMSRNAGKTYLLDTIFEAVSESHDKAMTAFFEAKDDDEKEDEKKESDGSDDVDKEDIKLGDADKDGVDDAQDSDFGTGADNDKNEESFDSKEKEDKEEEEEKEDKKEEDSEEEDKEEKEDEESESDDDEDDDEEDTSIDDLEAASEEDDDEEDVEDDSKEESDPVLDEPDTKESLAAAADEEPVEDEPEEDDINPDNKEELFDKLENDEDVTDAVDIIAKRISDAEAKFIEKNAEDKKKIENIVNKVQDRIDAVTQDDDSTEEEIDQEKEESQVEVARYISDIREDRFHTIFELMVRDDMDFIVKNQAIKESYIMENGKIDMTKIIDASRTLYGWLETVNTIQLEKVDEAYLEKILQS